MTQGLLRVNITSDNKQVQISLPLGSNVQEALTSAQVTLNEIDRVDPPLYTVLSEGSQVKVTRVREEFYTKQVILPFRQQELRNEALPEGEMRLSQPGVNGLEEITYHRVFEDGVEVSDTLEKSVVVKAAIPEVVMVGSRSTFTPMEIPGKIAYLSTGNAWVIETNTSNRRCVICSGDLDGRIFSVSRDGKYLLFTRISDAENTINSLCVVSLISNPAKIIDLGVKNIVHYAEFDPASNVVAYSTAEWREVSPGWQANNDLYELFISETGSVGTPQLYKQPNSGGVYGWWGTDFAWAPDVLRFLFSRPDGVGIIDVANGTQTTLINLTPYQTSGNWAWVPGAEWSPDGNVIYTVNPTSANENSSVESQEFDLVAVPLTGGSPVVLVRNVGMFAYPKPTPIIQNPNYIYNSSGEFLNQNDFSVAYLQAVFPDQSESSGYRLYTMDRDGSNQKSVFPQESANGIDPQHVIWSPDSIGNGWDYAIALIYNGDIWMIDARTGAAQQITGDGLTNRIDWR